LIAVNQATSRPIAIADGIVADKGYHSRAKLRERRDVGFRSYISEPDRPPQGWVDQHAERDAVYANRRRIRRKRGQRLLRKRGELLERPNAHLYETGGMRRVHLRGRPNIPKRILVHAAGSISGS
jgi:transposase